MSATLEGAGVVGQKRSDCITLRLYIFIYAFVVLCLYIVYVLCLIYVFFLVESGYFHIKVRGTHVPAYCVMDADPPLTYVDLVSHSYYGGGIWVGTVGGTAGRHFTRAQLVHNDCVSGLVQSDTTFSEKWGSNVHDSMLC